MHLKRVLLSAALMACLTGCGESVNAPPAPLINLGLHVDSATGAMIAGEGDTLWNIAQRYRLPLRDIIALNNLEPPYALARGQRLKLPAPVDYRTREGDTLYSIANTFGVGVYRLVQVNGLRAPYRVTPGQDLRIPSSFRHKVAPSVQIPQPLKSIARRKDNTSSPPATVLMSSKHPNFIWPVRGTIVSAYGPKEGGLYNEGINIAAPRGTPVAAAAGGVVAYVGNDLQSYGNMVLIRHGDGMMTAYAHLASIQVKKGTSIRKGQAIGFVGSTGTVATAQLHFEIRHKAKAYDPVQYLG